MMTSWRSVPLSFALAPVFALAFLLLALSGASAHEHREVGDYEITIGFLNEPAIVEEPNGLDLRVSRGHGEEGEPVEGLADTLQAAVIYGDQSMPLELRAAFGDPGAYKAEFIPTAEGAYTFHITGTIDGMEIDETFTSGPETFSEVDNRVDMNFPNEVAAVGDLSAAVTDASDGADSASMMAIVALIMGTGGLGAGVGALLLSRHETASSVVIPTAHEPAV